MHPPSANTPDQAESTCEDLGLLCPNCGYNLTGHFQRVCPKCGQVWDLRTLYQALHELGVVLRCMNCGYNIARDISITCPECGQGFDPRKVSVGYRPADERTWLASLRRYGSYGISAAALLLTLFLLGTALGGRPFRLRASIWLLVVLSWTLFILAYRGLTGLSGARTLLALTVGWLLAALVVLLL